MLICPVLLFFPPVFYYYLHAKCDWRNEKENGAFNLSIFPEGPS